MRRQLPAVCHPERVRWALGLCGTCYVRKWRLAHKKTGSISRLETITETITDSQGNTVQINRTRFESYIQGGIWMGHRDRNGYGEFTCKVNGKWRPVKCHRIAWMLAYGPIPAGLWVLHKNDNPSCVDVTQLFIGTHRDNMDDCVRKGRMCRGERNPSARLTAAQVLEAKDMLSHGLGPTEIGKRFGVSKYVIHDIKRGHCWTHIGG